MKLYIQYIVHPSDKNSNSFEGKTEINITDNISAISTTIINHFRYILSQKIGTNERSIRILSLPQQNFTYDTLTNKIVNFTTLYEHNNVNYPTDFAIISNIMNAKIQLQNLKEEFNTKIDNIIKQL